MAENMFNRALNFLLHHAVDPLPIQDVSLVEKSQLPDIGNREFHSVQVTKAVLSYLEKSLTHVNNALPQESEKVQNYAATYTNAFRHG